MPIAVTNDGPKWHWAAITHEQIAAAASPDERTAEMLGNFEDLLELLDRLAQPMPPIELGKPMPQARFLPKLRAGDCPAAHNRGLLDDSRGD